MTNRLAMLTFCASLATGAAAAIHAGGHMDITDAVSSGLYVAGGRVTVSAPVTGKTRIAAGRVEIAEGASLKDTAIAGGRYLSGPRGDFK